MFDRKVFEKTFNASIRKLTASEGISKDMLKALSRSVIEAHHATGNNGYINKLIAVLSPMNKKACIVFFKHFSGYHYDEEACLFVGKRKKRYDAAHKESMEFLQDPNNNLWSWAERHIEVEQKPFNPESFKASFKKSFEMNLQKARDNGISQSDMLKLVLQAGVEINTLIDLMGEMELVNVEEAPF